MELMHNFTLVHDDIMDRATSRRGRPTVHTTWGSNNALLVGDILLGLAFKHLLETRAKRLQRVLHVFTAGLLDVCEGQALDVEFERRSNVSVNEYFVMIRKKTARLLSAAAELGGLIGEGTEKQIVSLRKFGDSLGRAFQLQDDLLDVVADEKEFGKRIGGDILEGKKTFLLLKALEQAKGNDRKALLRVIHRSTSPPLRTKAEREREVNKVARIYESSGAIDAARKKIREETHRAQRALQSLPKNRAQETLYWLSQMLLTRSS
jgi:geranylgeranyl diphosphate synthase type II